jgi:cystathionine beta-lyase/cystathionine gamma-synthase
MAGPWTGWLLLRSLETLKPRMETQARNAAQVAAFLKAHPKVKKVHYLGFLDTAAQQAIFDSQCLSAWSHALLRCAGRRTGSLPIPQRAEAGEAGRESR